MIYKVPIDTLHLYTYVYRDYGYIIYTRATLNGDTITSSLITGIIFYTGE